MGEREKGEERDVTQSLFPTPLTTTDLRLLRCSALYSSLQPPSATPFPPSTPSPCPSSSSPHLLPTSPPVSHVLSPPVRSPPPPNYLLLRSLTLLYRSPAPTHPHSTRPRSLQPRLSTLWRRRGRWRDRGRARMKP